VSVPDPHVPTPTLSLEEALEGAELVVVASNHSEFCRPEVLAAIAERAAPDCLVVDPWNCWGGAQVFAYASELAALGAHP
jgi:UDP-N-acetyl-D-mannosaminuronic acid dehydrogenase